MNQEVLTLVRTAAANANITVEPTFQERVDAYMNRFFAANSAREKLIIETYLSQAALRITITEGRNRLAGEDFKAAVWLFHQPGQPDDPCAEAGRAALRSEGTRAKYTRGLLHESFARRLDFEK